MSISRGFLALVTCVAVTIGVTTACSSDKPAGEVLSFADSSEQSDLFRKNAHIFMPVDPALNPWVLHIGLDGAYAPNDERAAEGYDGFAEFGERCMVSINFAGAVAKSDVTVRLSSRYTTDNVAFGTSAEPTTTVRMGNEAQVRQMLASSKAACRTV